jgi:hypothetical protein
VTWTNCPSFAELFATDVDVSDEVRAHIASCPRCQALKRHLSPTAIESATDPSAKEPQRRAFDVGQRLGSVYAIHGPASDEYLLGALVDWDAEEAVVVPLSDEVRYATNWDLLLEQKLLGYPAMAEVWNHGTVLIEQLNEKIAELGDSASAVEALYTAALDATDVPTRLPVGPQVLNEIDPRNAFQDREGERVAGYWQPATLLARVESVFELVRAQRDELDIVPEAIDALEPAALDQLEAGKLDIGNQVPTAVFAGLLNRLQVTASQRLERLIAAAVIATYQEPLETRTAVARKRRGMRKPAQTVDRDRFAADYARRVIEEMKA